MVAAQETWTDRSRIYPDRLRNIPTGLLLYHSPNPNYPEVNTEKEGAAYKWVHSTCVIAQIDDLQVVEAGSFIWTQQSGWIPNMKFGPGEVARRFGNSEEVLQKETTYCFDGNTRYSNQLFGGDALWYVLARDSSGNLYKGVGIIETESEIQKTED